MTDFGHGGGSFGFRATEGMLVSGFLADVISSNVHALSINGPAFDQLTTMSKLLCLGVGLVEVTGRVHSRLRRRSAGKISEGWRAGRSATQLCSNSARGSSIIAAS
jgi:dihydroorotase